MRAYSLTRIAAFELTEDQMMVVPERADAKLMHDGHEAGEYAPSGVSGSACTNDPDSSPGAFAPRAGS
jgi:hypothetical protein